MRVLSRFVAAEFNASPAFVAFFDPASVEPIQGRFLVLAWAREVLFSFTCSTHCGDVQRLGCLCILREQCGWCSSLRKRGGRGPK